MEVEPIKYIVELGSSFLLWLGGGAVVFTGVTAFLANHFASRAIEREKGKLSAELERLKGDLSAELERLKGELTKDVETHKLALRRVEALFEREVSAATELSKLLEQITPDYRPGMDRHEVVVHVASQLETLEGQLKIMLLRHGVILPASIRKKLENSRWQAAEAKFDAAGEHPAEPPDSAVHAAESILSSLEEAQQELLDVIRS